MVDFFFPPVICLLLCLQLQLLRCKVSTSETWPKVGHRFLSEQHFAFIHMIFECKSQAARSGDKAKAKIAAAAAAKCAAL